MSQDIKLASNDDLINELKSRFDTFVVAGQRKENAAGSVVDTWDFSGDYITAQGLCSMLQHKINKERDEIGTELENAP